LQRAFEGSNAVHDRFEVVFGDVPRDGLDMAWHVRVGQQRAGGHVVPLGERDVCDTDRGRLVLATGPPTCINADIRSMGPRSHHDDGSTESGDVIAWIVMVAAPTKQQRRSRTSSPSTTRTQSYTVILGSG
jgi:hypothetical protein